MHLDVSIGKRSHELQFSAKGFDVFAQGADVPAIPMWSCQACGESYFTAQTVHQFERTEALRKSIAKKRVVPVAEFEAAATA
jgi:hypothetical protein